MHRRQFLLALAALGGGATFPALATIEKHHGEVDLFRIVEPASEAQQSIEPASPKIGLVAVGSGGCGMLAKLHGKLPYLSRTVAIDKGS